MTDLDDLIAYPNLQALSQGLMSGNFSEYPQLRVEAERAIARLVSLRDAEKELPVEPSIDVMRRMADREISGYDKTYTELFVRVLNHIDALRAHAVADRARVKEVERERDRHMGAVQAYIEDADAMKKRAESAEAELNALKAALREPTKEMREAACRAYFGDAVYKNVSERQTTYEEDELVDALKAMTAAMETKGD